MPCVSDIAMQQGMQHSLTSATGAFPTCKLMKDAFWSPCGFCRVNNIIANDEKHRCQYSDDDFSTFGHTNSISGR